MTPRLICETDSASEARNLAAGYESIGVPVEVIPGRTHRYAVRERVRWDRAYLVWRKAFMRVVRA